MKHTVLLLKKWKRKVQCNKKEKKKKCSTRNNKVSKTVQKLSYNKLITRFKRSHTHMLSQFTSRKRNIKSKR